MEEKKSAPQMRYDKKAMARISLKLHLENINTLFIEQGIERYERLKKLNTLAISQLKTLISNRSVQQLKNIDTALKTKEK